MSGKKILYTLFLFLLSFVMVLNADFRAYSQSDMRIKDAVLDMSRNAIFIKTIPSNEPIKYNIIKLSEPDRLVIDLSDSVLTIAKKNIDLQNSDIKTFKIAQFSSDPKVVRIVLLGSSVDSFKNISLSKSSDYLVIKLRNAPQKKITKSKLYSSAPLVNSNKLQIQPENNTSMKPVLRPEVKKTNYTPVSLNRKSNSVITKPGIIYNSINFADNNLKLSGIGRLSIKEPFILSEPTRIVFDLPGSDISDLNGVKAFNFNNGDTIRVGRFEKNVVRVVIETDNPSAYTNVVSSDSQSIIFANKNDINISELSNNKTRGFISSINVLNKDSSTSVITFVFSQPIIHNLKKDKNLNIYLYNIAPPGNEFLSKLPKTEQFKGITNVAGIEKYPLGSSFVLPINIATKVKSRLSMDGKILEIILKDPKVIISSRNGSNSKKIVIDPGHGGDDPGATRCDIFEKDITLSVAKLVEKYLTNAGFEVIMTRNDDSTISLKERTDITNEENPGAFISIHVNASENFEARGIETHYFKDQGRLLAELIQCKMAAKMIDTPDRGVIRSMFYVINHTEVPAALVEIGFISNDIERAMLLNPIRQNNIAQSIVESILEFRNIKNSQRY